MEKWVSWILGKYETRFWRSRAIVTRICQFRINYVQVHTLTKYHQVLLYNIMQSHPSFTKLPKSELLSKLEAFLPVMAAENKKLSEAVAAGEGAKHNIEIGESEEDTSDDDDNALTGRDKEKNQDKGVKVPVIEMNFALGTMDENIVDVDDSVEAVGAKAHHKSMAAEEVFNGSPGSKHESSSFEMRLKKPSNKPHAVIQELN